MITNFSFGVPGEIADADYPMPLGNYFDIEKDMTQVGDTVSKSVSREE